MSLWRHVLFAYGLDHHGRFLSELVEFSSIQLFTSRALIAKSSPHDQALMSVPYKNLLYSCPAEETK